MSTVSGNGGWGADLVAAFWSAVLRIQPRSSRDGILLDHVVAQLTQLIEQRRRRHLEVQHQLVGILWVVLIVGAVFTVAICCLFGVDHFAIHSIKTLALTSLIAPCSPRSPSWTIPSREQCA